VVRPRGSLDFDDAVRLRQLLVHAIRHLRPHRLVLDLSGVTGLDPVNIGIMAAACVLGDDHEVAVFLDDAPADVAAMLAAAGVPSQRLRSTRAAS
jgi:anti-anti-sigma factor